MPVGKSYSSSSNKSIIEKAHKAGKISKKQMEKLPESLLLGIAKRRKPSGK